MNGVLTRPVDDPAAWRGTEMARRTDWIVTLSPRNLAEIGAALEQAKARGLDALNMTRADFPLPTLGTLLENLREDLEGGRGFAVLRGLQVADYLEEDGRIVLWGIGAYIGVPEPQDGAGNLIHSVRETNDPLRFHNDGSDTFMLMCLRQAKSGGRSRLASAVQIFNDIVERRPDLAEVLQQDFHMDARGQRPDGVKVQVMPICHWFAGKLSVNLKLRYIHTAQRFAEVPRLSAAQQEAIRMFEAVAEENVMAFDMQPGDVQIANNYAIIHSRTGFVDWPEPDRRRHMLRLWLTIPNGRPLPPAFEGSREYGASYARRMTTQDF
jgi:hypothetical protein